MENEEDFDDRIVSSDVKILGNQSKEEDEFVSSIIKVRFEAEDQKADKSQTTNSFSDSEVKIDSDGDYEVPRPKKDKETEIKENQLAGKYEDHKSDEDIEIKHQLSTPLEQINRQLWTGGVYLAAFLCSKCPELLRGSNILEVGAGTGFASLVILKFLLRKTVWVKLFEFKARKI